MHQRRMQNGTALYVGSDRVRQNRLGGYLQSLGIDLHKASSMPAAKQKLCQRKYALLLIEFEPVRRHIFDLCRFAHGEYYEAVILILMVKVMPMIESKLFECGIVDDIVAGKQTFPVALMSRIKRRLVSRLSVPKTNKIMLKGGAIIDLERREVLHNGLQHRLNGVTYKLLQYFLENPHRTISREELLKSRIWDNSVCSPGKVEQGKAIDMAVMRLRRLIEPDPSNPQIIATVRGIGWMLEKDAVI